MIHHMRTTLNIEDDVLFAVKQFSRERHESAGHLISELVRKTLRPTSVGRERNGVPMFPAKPGAKVVSMDLVNRLRDEALFQLAPTLSANQTTDVYLLGLAVKHGGKLATTAGQTAV